MVHRGACTLCLLWLAGTASPRTRLLSSKAPALLDALLADACPAVSGGVVFSSHHRCHPSQGGWGRGSICLADVGLCCLAVHPLGLPCRNRSVPGASRCGGRCSAEFVPGGGPQWAALVPPSFCERSSRWPSGLVCCRTCSSVVAGEYHAGLQWALHKKQNLCHLHHNGGGRDRERHGMRSVPCCPSGSPSVG